MTVQLKVLHGWHSIFLRERQKGYTVDIAALRAGVKLDRLYTERRLNSEFATAWEEAEKTKKQPVRW